jgi:hypothetical protein
MKTFSLLIGMFLAVVVIAVLLLVFGANFGRPSPASALYNPANEISLTGTIAEVQDFTCPISGREIGRHLQLQTGDGIVQVHLLPSRILRGQRVDFKPGDHIAVIGSKTHLLGKDAVIAREVIRGPDTFVFRDKSGSVLMQQ